MVQMQRGRRYPRIACSMKAEPFKLYPICFHPVLPGETVRDMYVDGRVHLNGVQSQLMGWFHDVIYCYVKLRDIDGDLVDQFIDPDWSVPAEYASSTQRDLGMFGTADPNYIEECTKLVYKLYYAREEEYYNGGLPILPLKYPDCFQGFFELAEDADQDLGDEADILADMIEDKDTYADVLEAYGLSDAIVARTLPEILMWQSWFNYPVLSPIDDNSEILNRSSCLWTVREARGTRKGIYISEPGFIIGLAATRPDVVSYNKKKWKANTLVGQKDWLVPPYELVDGIGTEGANSFENWGYASSVHVNNFDLWLNGETFTNIDPDDTLTGTQLRGNVAKLPYIDAGFTDIRSDYPRQGAETDLDTYIPQLLASDYYQGFSYVTRMSIQTPLVA